MRLPIASFLACLALALAGCGQSDPPKQPAPPTPKTA